MIASILVHSRNTRVTSIPLFEDTESAKAIYDGDKQANLVVLDLQAFNRTTNGMCPSQG